MKRCLLAFALIISLFVFLSGCQSDTVSNEQIKSDIISHEQLENFDVEITDFSVIKRQTNEEKKEDIVWVKFSGENENYSFVKSFKAKYILYNEGWSLETVEIFNDKNAENYVKPKHGVEDVSEYEDSFAGTWSNWASWPEDVHHSELGKKYTHNGIPELEQNYGTDSYSVTAKYEYAAITETVTVPLNFLFEQKGDGDWGWVMYISKEAIKRDLVFNDGILGYWTSHYEGEALANNDISAGNIYFQNNGMELNVLSHTDNTCTVDFCKHKKYSTSGTLKLDFNVNKKGEISFVRLKWVEPENADFWNPSFCSYLGMDYLEVYDYSLANIS